MMVKVKAAQQSGRSGESTARTVGVENAWVGSVSKMASNVLPSRNDPAKDLDMVRSVSQLCLRTLNNALSGLNKVSAMEGSSAPSLTPEELRLLAAGLRAGGQCIKVVNTFASVGQATPMCASKPGLEACQQRMPCPCDEPASRCLTVQVSATLGCIAVDLSSRFQQALALEIMAPLACLSGLYASNMSCPCVPGSSSWQPSLASLSR